MSKKTEFINYVAGLIETNPMSDEAKAYWNVFSNTPEVEKPLLTDNGKIVLGYMQKKEIGEQVTAKALAEEIFTSSRTAQEGRFEISHVYPAQYIPSPHSI